MKKLIFNITGIHCRSCKILIEGEVKRLPGVGNIEVDHRAGECRLEFDESKISGGKIFKAIEELNYGIEGEKTAPTTQGGARKRLIMAGALLVLFALGYYLITRLGLLEIISALNEPKIGYGLIFLIGLLVSFHCVGMCGGLVVTYTARHHADNDGQKTNHSSPHLWYNAGRILSYTLIGAVLGGFGSFFGINPDFTGAITLFAGVFMVLMGLSLLTRFRWLEKIKLRAPDFIARFLYGGQRGRKPKGPFLIGILNGFMPCGPLQAIELYALASGSVTRGALSMGIFALGTVPLMFGFGNFISLISRERIAQVMKLSGAIVIILGIFMANRGLANFGYGFDAPASGQIAAPAENGVEGQYQTISMDLTYYGYSPNTLYIKRGVPVRWVINVKQMTGCTNAIMIESLGIKRDLALGENVILFTPPDDAREIKFSCWMRMVWGRFVVTDDDLSGSIPNTAKAVTADTPAPTCGASAGCGGTGCSCGCGGPIN